MGGHSTVECEMHRMQFSDLHCALWKDRIIGFGWRRDPQIGPLIVDTASMLVTLRFASAINTVHCNAIKSGSAHCNMTK